MKNKNISFITIPVLLLSFVFFTSCYTKYYGKYRLGDSLTYKFKPASKEDYNKLYEAVKKVALDYGFVQMKKGTFGKLNDIGFGKASDRKSHYDTLEGSEDGTTIILFLGPYPYIAINDPDTIYESEFMKSLKHALVKSLSKVIDMHGVVFRRQLKIFF